LASLTCVFYLRHSSNWNPHRLHSEPFLFFPPKERHNVGLLRFDDDHDHICYRLRRFKYLAEKVMSSNHYSGDLSTGRSTSGVLCLHSGAPISWMSQRQSSVAISTTEAEVVAASEAAREIIWIKRILTELDQLKATPTLQIDNEAAIRLAQNPEFHRRTKHIRIRHFFVRELVTAGEIMVSKVDSEKQLADILTKPLFSTRFRDLCNDMGICKLLNKGEC
jgi:hypothetical protein